MKIPKPSVTSKSFEGLKALLKEKAVSLPYCRVSIPVREIELGPEREEELFQEAMAGVDPISRENCVERILVFRPSEREASQKGERQEDAEALSRLTRLVKEGEGFRVEDTPEYIEGTSYDVPAEIAGRLHQGRYSIQAHLDLHGMNAQDAKTVFEKFLKWAVATGKKRGSHHPWPGAGLPGGTGFKDPGGGMADPRALAEMDCGLCQRPALRRRDRRDVCAPAGSSGYEEDEKIKGKMGKGAKGEKGKKRKGKNPFTLEPSAPRAAGFRRWLSILKKG